MRRYGQFCPVAKTAEVLCQRWTALILRNLCWGATRFSELQRGVPMMSPTLLSQRLKELEKEGIVERRGAGRGGSYHLTEAGRDFAPIVEAMGVWGQRWARRELEPEEIDMDLLLWGIERSARADAFGRQPAVVQVSFPDQPAGKQVWWYLMDEDRCQLCVDDPGRAVDLYVSGTVADVIRVYRGDVSLAHALASGRIEALGAEADRRALGPWLNLSPLAAIPSRRREGVA